MPLTPASLVTQINDIYTPLLSGLSFDLSLPLELSNVDLIVDQPVFSPTSVPNLPALTTASLTAGDGTLTGNGTFDVLMRAINKHLDSQYQKQRLSGAEWGKVYIQALELALTQGSNYLVASTNAAWNAENAKRQAELLEIQKATLTQESRTKILETVTAKLLMAQTQINAHVAQGQLVATKVKVGDTYHDILAKETQQLLISEQVDQARSVTKDTLQNGAVVAGMALVDKNLKTKQITLVNEQIDAARAQTKNTIVDGVTTVTGILGAQRELYEQQKQSFVHDSMNKAVRILADGWTTQKTVDEGWTPPDSFLNAYIDPALKRYADAVGVGTNPA